jgi:hypothetical protein
MNEKSFVNFYHSSPFDSIIEMVWTVAHPVSTVAHRGRPTLPQKKKKIYIYIKKTETKLNLIINWFVVSQKL